MFRVWGLGLGLGLGLAEKQALMLPISSVGIVGIFVQNVYTCVYMCTCVHVCTYVHVCVSTCAFVCVCVCVCVYVCKYIQVYMYVYEFLSFWNIAVLTSIFGFRWAVRGGSPVVP